MEREDNAVFWLSPQQKLAWTFSQEVLRASSRAACMVRISGSLDPERLKNSLSALIRRHESLRTTFRRQTGMKVPFQVVADSSEFGWAQLDLSSAAASEQNGSIEELFSQEVAHDIETSETTRALLISLGAEKFRLIISVHPLCADLRSLQVLVHELGIIYSGKQDSLPEPFRYVQFAQWQSDMLESAEDDAREGRDFWTRKGSTPPEPVQVPGEHKSAGDFKAEKFAIAVPAEVSGLLPSTSEMPTLLAAWECLLTRISGMSSVTVSFSADGREFEELENAIGCFAKSLPLTTEFAANAKFSEILQHTTDSVRELISAQEYFAPELNATAVDRIGFAYSKLDGSAGFDGIDILIDALHVVSEPFKLRLVALRCGAELDLEFHYDASHFERSAIERIAGYYQNFLRAALANPETLVSNLPLLSEADRKQLVVEWNQTASEFPVSQCLHGLFEAQAAKTPERIAVRCGEQALSYRELNERANQLAHYLRKQGVGPDKPVGICLDRSGETMVAVLAILKAGGAYVPLNADNPPARLKQQLEGAAALITESKFLGNLPQFGGQECPPHKVVLDRDQTRWASETKSNPAVNTNPENLAYVIYTSGSTGVPKGVAVRHRNLVNYSDFITKRLELHKYPEGLQFATVSTLGADLGNTCIYPSLICGGTLHVIGYDMATDPRRFAEYTAKYPIDVLKIVPSHLQALLQSEEAKNLLPRKYLITGGETLTPKLIEKIESLNPSCEVINHYGPTETTVGSLTLKLKDYDWKSAKLTSIPIGKPIQNTQVYILDQNLAPVPVGVTGELYIAGAGVTAGYLGQAEKTAERFINNPFSTDPNARMYRTGDLSRYGEDGNIEFLGRGDDQVKVRGFRIELGEIESILSRNNAVKQAVVLAREDAQGEKRLLAYVVLNREAGEVKAEDLRNYLKQQLPDYMVPQAVMVLPKLPLNANGKIDREALPEPEQAQTRAYVAPRNETERKIAEIWAEVLRRDTEQISIEDNFFDLGGHSLLATQVISRIRTSLSVEIPMRLMFDQPRITGLAEAVSRAKLIEVEEEPELSPVSREMYRAGAR